VAKLDNSEMCDRSLLCNETLTMIRVGDLSIGSSAGSNRDGYLDRLPTVGYANGV
jgi:hypothetical protein